MPINYKRYHPKWTLIVRLIRKRSGNRCEGSPAYPACRAENGKPHPVTGSKVVCTTAHMDHNRENNRFWNLKHLCQRCHLHHDRKQHAFNRKYGRETKRVNGKFDFTF
jgi:hypothetical protein